MFPDPPSKTEGVRYIEANSVAFVGKRHQTHMKYTINLLASVQECGRDKIHNHKAFQDTGVTNRETPAFAVLDG